MCLFEETREVVDVVDDIDREGKAKCLVREGEVRCRISVHEGRGRAPVPCLVEHWLGNVKTEIRQVSPAIPQCPDVVSGSATDLEHSSASRQNVRRFRER